MKKPNINKSLQNFKLAASKHSPEILTGLGIGGLVTTTILAVRATPKALELIDKETTERKYIELEDADDISHVDYIALTKLEIVKLTWKLYIPAAITGITSITCLIGATSVNAKRNAALATAYKLSEAAFIEYKDKVVETIGDKKEKVIREKVAEDRIKKNPPVQNSIIMTGKGTTLFLEPVSGRYFQSDIEKIKRIENSINKRMLHDISGYMSLNDFYDELGLEHTSIGYDLGWNAYNLLEIDYIPQLTDEDQPCVYLEYTNAPKYGYTNF